VGEAGQADAEILQQGKSGLNSAQMNDEKITEGQAEEFEARTIVCATRGDFRYICGGGSGGAGILVVAHTR
jgi:hypothetical protein